MILTVMRKTYMMIFGPTDYGSNSDDNDDSGD